MQSLGFRQLLEKDACAGGLNRFMRVMGTKSYDVTLANAEKFGPRFNFEFISWAHRTFNTSRLDTYLDGSPYMRAENTIRRAGVAFLRGKITQREARIRAARAFARAWIASH